jgi:TonB-linked SusC/RagA family outer membrane protein
MKKFISTLQILLCTVIFTLPSSAQQKVTITGIITDEFGQPLNGVLVELLSISENLKIRTFSDNTGKYKLDTDVNPNKPENEYRLRTWFDGYYPYEAGIVLDFPEVKRNILLNADPLSSGEKYRTGIDLNSKRNQRTYNINKITSGQINTSPSQNPGITLQGKIAGVKAVTSGGNPDLVPNILMGTANSVFNGNYPLVIIDGIYSSWGLEDIEVNDIRDIQVTQGAAGSAGYGVRGSNGVIEIFTDRGTKAPGIPVIKLRSEYGVGIVAPHDFPVTTHHHYLTDGTKWIDNNGNEVEPGDRVLDTSGPNGTVFLDNEYFLSIFDNIDSFFETGHFYSNYVSINQTSGTSSWKLSASSLGNSGIIKNLDGYHRNTFRMNFHKQATSNLHFTIGGYLTKSDSDNPRSYNNNLNPFEWLLRIPVDFNIDPKGSFYIPRNDGSQRNPVLISGLNVPNPIIHTDLYRKEIDRIRAMSNINVLYESSADLIFESNFGIDNLDLNDTEFIPYDLPDSTSGNWLPFFCEQKKNLFSFNTDISVLKKKDIKALETIWKLQYSYQNLSTESENSLGMEITIDEKGTENWKDSLTTYTKNIDFNVHGLSLESTWNYNNKLMGDIVLRTDVNSQMTGDEKWNNYYRISTAYRVSEEPWFRLSDTINDFKIRYAIGTAGSLRNFLPNTNLVDDFLVSVYSGNYNLKDLKPEFSVENNIGLDITFLDRISMGFDYSFITTRNQLFNVTNSLLSNELTKWQNLGTVESDNFNFDLKINLVHSRDFSWTTGFIVSRADQRIKKLDRTYFLNSVEGYYYLKEGDDLGSIYGKKWATGISDLGEFGRINQNQFQVNDDGLLVWVGNGNTWQDGLSKSLWGQSTYMSGAGISRELSWGMPIEIIDNDGSSDHRIGKLTPDFTWSWSNTIRWNEFTINMLMDAQVGGSIYNYSAQKAYRDYTHFTLDQFSKLESMKKPLEYYEIISGPYGYNSWFLENGSFVKLRNFSVKYNFRKDKIRDKFGETYAETIRSLSIGVVLRNWLTWSDYTGFDPDTGGLIYRFDDGKYPNARQISAFIEIEF